jgi:hypothetical protein
LKDSEFCLKNKINFNAALNSQVQILSDFNNFWYKLGFNDGVYIFSSSKTALFANLTCKIKSFSFNTKMANLWVKCYNH